MPAVNMLISTFRGSSTGIFPEQKTKLISEERVVQHGPPPAKQGVDYINLGEEDQMEIYGYCRDLKRTVVTWICIFLTLGMLRLVFHWCPRWMLLATHRQCKLKLAEKILVVEHFQETHKSYYVKDVTMLVTKNFDFAALSSCANKNGDGMFNRSVEDVQKACNGKLSYPLGSAGQYAEVESIKTFRCKKLNYLWREETEEFYKLCGFDEQIAASSLHEQKGLEFEDQCRRRIVYGNNEIVVKVQSRIKLLFLEVLNPFYVFQIYSVILWYFYDYRLYATAIVIMSLWGIISTIFQTRRNQENLRSTIHSSDRATVWRGGKDYDDIPTEHLVPGDVIIIPSHGCVMHCDAVLLSGNCIVNESMLTGESVPVTKTPIANRSDVAFNMKEHSRHTLFCGTQVIQTRYYGSERVLAVVLRTGFLTAKGNLVRSIMYPPPVDYKFEQDSYKFVGFLAVVAAIGFVYTIVSKYVRGSTISTIILESLDLITIVVPPALPAAMTVGRLYAQNRLKKKKIYCISPRAINVAGSINCVCFDKTGTLTEDGLDMWGVVPVIHREAQMAVRDIKSLPHEFFLRGMATCHSLTTIDGKLSGDPLDVKMFKSTGWIFEEPEVNDSTKFDMIAPTIVRSPKPLSNGNVVHPDAEIGIIRQFPFSSPLQRMSVVTRTLGEIDSYVFCKGSPEMIASLSYPESVPVNFDAILQHYAQEGYRVIAMGYRPLKKMSYPKMQRATREEIERDLTFLGFVVLENRLKPETEGVLADLKEACIRTVMVTGDNMLTALSVARDCGMIDQTEPVILVDAEPEENDRPPRIVYTYAENTQKTFLRSKQNSIASEISADEHSITKLTEVAVNVDSASRPYHFALTGKTFAIIWHYYPTLLNRLATRGTVFARMSPDQKQQLVQVLQDLGYYVGMCGDGANDCGALKAAHTGISLSETEASVASPFTYKETNICCVPELIREGRAALVTSFGIFKYMAAYSLVQFVSVTILYNIDSNLTDAQFLYIDLFLITVFAFFFGMTEAYDGQLHKIPPKASLVSITPVASILLQILVSAGFQVAALYYIVAQPFYKPFKPENEEDFGCLENFSVFSVSSFQYVLLAVVYSKGRPYRKSFVTNYGLMSSLTLLTAFTVYLVVYPCSWLAKTFEFVLPPVYFRAELLVFWLVNAVVCCLVEYVVVDVLIDRMDCRRLGSNESEKYRAVEKELCTFDWPPISPTAPSPQIAKEPRKFPVALEVMEELPLAPANLLEDSKPIVLNGYRRRRDSTGHDALELNVASS